MRNNFTYLLCLFIASIFFYFITPSCSKKSDTSTRRPNTVTITSNVKYGSNKDWQGNIVNLFLDVYTPPNLSTTQKIPLIIYVHGGGFLDGSKEDKKAMMIDFASSGFVAASINYRLGWTQADSCNGDTTEAKEAIYRAVQDARSAIRFLVANAENYHIDTSKIFLSGESAGAITVLSTNYFTQSYADNLIPGAETKLGTLDFADNNFKNAFTIKGIASVAGCLSSADLISSFNVKPTIYMHGYLDNVVPYNVGTNFNCHNYSKCFGDYYLYKITKVLAPSVMHLDSTGTHNIYNEDFIKTNQACFFNSIIQNTTDTGFFTGAALSCR